VFEHLQIYDTRERLIVGAADLLLAGAGPLLRRSASRRRGVAPERILALRLERIGDLVMTLGALAALRARAPDAAIHLVVGSWNESIARSLPDVTTVETVDVPWLARHAAGEAPVALVKRALAWRSRRFDLAVNFEPDIRSNFLLALSGAPVRVGFSSGGGTAFLTAAVPYEPHRHTAVNALRIVDLACPAAAGTSSTARLSPPARAREEAGLLLNSLGIPAGRPVVGIHPSGGRQVKQWHLDRFAEVAGRLAREQSAAIVLTGAPEDRAVVDGVAARLPPDVRAFDLARPMALDVFAAVIERLAVLVSGDTGPMHLAAAVGTPVVALFGPSDPARYGPLDDRARVITADLWCRPCNRVRRPPERCSHGVPDCLTGIDVETVYRAASALLPPATDRGHG
jgi:lipopolysaccharide heptosyltransferase II